MSSRRGPGLVGLLWAILGLVLILSAVDLMRGRDSTLRSWWSEMPGPSDRSLKQLVPRERFRPTRP